MASSKRFLTKEPGSSYNFTLLEMLQFQQAVFFFFSTFDFVSCFPDVS